MYLECRARLFRSNILSGAVQLIPVREVLILNFTVCEVYLITRNNEVNIDGGHFLILRSHTLLDEADGGDETILLETSTLVLEQCQASFLGSCLTSDVASHVGHLLTESPHQDVGLLSLCIILGRNHVGVLHLTQSVGQSSFVVLLRVLSGLLEACFTRQEIVLNSFGSRNTRIGLELILSLELLLGVTQLANLGKDEVLNLCPCHTGFVTAVHVIVVRNSHLAIGRLQIVGDDQLHVANLENLFRLGVNKLDANQRLTVDSLTSCHFFILCFSIRIDGTRSNNDTCNAVVSIVVVVNLYGHVLRLTSHVDTILVVNQIKLIAESELLEHFRRHLHVVARPSHEETEVAVVGLDERHDVECAVVSYRVSSGLGNSCASGLPHVATQTVVTEPVSRSACPCAASVVAIQDGSLGLVVGQCLDVNQRRSHNHEVRRYACGFVVNLAYLSLERYPVQRVVQRSKLGGIGSGERVLHIVAVSGAGNLVYVSLPCGDGEVHTNLTVFINGVLAVNLLAHRYCEAVDTVT